MLPTELYSYRKGDARRNGPRGPDQEKSIMVNEQVRHHDESGGLASLFVAMVELGDATTKFTVNQIQNGVDVFMDPGRALDRMRRSINNFSAAMYRSARPDREHHEPETDKDLTGRHYAVSEERGANGHNGGTSHQAAEHEKHTAAGEHTEHANRTRK
jgi:hypothetical protein